MKKILYFSDCYFFAGCENMIANFINSEDLNQNFDVQLIYRYSERYEAGLKTRISNLSKCKGTYLIGDVPQDKYVKSNNRLISLFQKCIWAIMFIFNKYYAIYKNTKILKKEITEFSPEIVHINNGGYPAASSCYAAVFAAHSCGVEDIYYVVNNMAEGYSHPFRWFDIILDHFVKNYVKLFVTGSNNAGNRLKNVLSLSDSKHITIRNGINLRPTTMTVYDFKKKYNIPEHKIIFSTIANLEERKGHRYLLQAIKELRDENLLQNCFFVFEGKGPNEFFIKQYIANNDLSSYVKLISVDTIFDLYAATDVTVLPSVANEDFPNIIIESMGMGTPVIGTKIAGIPEQIKHGETGILIEPANSDALKKAIIEMFENNELRHKCGANAKSVFAANYTSEKSIVNYKSLYCMYNGK